MDDERKVTVGHDDLKDKFGASARRMIKVDVERYQGYLDGTDMTDAQKEEFLQAIWLVMVSFVELGFEVHPVQEVCGKDSESATQRAVGAFDTLHSSEPKDKNKEQKPRP